MTTSRRRFAFTGQLEDASNVSYSLLALPSSLLPHLDSLEIRSAASTSTAKQDETPTTGGPAVLVTPETTYSIRGVQNSNSICLCATAPNAQVFASEEAIQDEKEGQISIYGVLHETLEVKPEVGRTDGLVNLLKGTDYTGEGNEDPMTPRKTLRDLQNSLPASDGEIWLALARNRIVSLDSSIRLVPLPYLSTLLSALLRSWSPVFVKEETQPSDRSKKEKKSKRAAKSETIEDELEVDFEAVIDTLDANDCSAEVGRKVLRWFGEPIEGKDGRWTIRVKDVVREVGIGVLSVGGFGPQNASVILDKWRTNAGEFQSLCDLTLLAGHYVALPPPSTDVLYHPASRLSPDPATRFAELFAIKARWLDDDMTVFVDDLTGGDKKKRDALIMKFVRKVKEGEQTWWAARNLWG